MGVTTAFITGSGAHLVFQGIPSMFSGILQVFMKYVFPRENRKDMTEGCGRT